MLYKFSIICDETPEFFREIAIEPDQTFLDLNKAILESCNYGDDQMTSFCTCSDEWETEHQIVREDMGTISQDEDIYIMADTRLSELLMDEEQKLIFTFDPINDRIFYIELTEIVTGKTLDHAECTISKGEAPKQTSDFDLDFSTLTKTGAANDLDLDFDAYGSEGYNEDEYDPESYGIDGEY